MKNTITDNNDYKSKTLNEARFNLLSETDKEYFQILKNAILEIFPLNDKNQHEEIMQNYAENFAFISTKAFTSLTKKYDEKIKELESKLNAASTQQTNTKANV